MDNSEHKRRVRYFVDESDIREGQIETGLECDSEFIQTEPTLEGDLNLIKRTIVTMMNGRDGAPIIKALMAIDRIRANVYSNDQ